MLIIIGTFRVPMRHPSPLSEDRQAGKYSEAKGSGDWRSRLSTLLPSIEPLSEPVTPHPLQLITAEKANQPHHL